MLTSKNLASFNPADMDVKLSVYKGFLLSTAMNVRDGDNELIEVLDQAAGDYISGVQHINMGSVAKVCDTDIITIENVVREIVS